MNGVDTRAIPTAAAWKYAPRGPGTIAWASLILRIGPGTEMMFRRTRYRSTDYSYMSLLDNKIPNATAL